jgi:uncharacterized protein (UPF0248 family)
MIPIHQLLNRIRWDKEFGQGQFEIGYWDRVSGQVQRVPLQDISFSEGESFNLVDEAGLQHRIPLHRVREVHKDGELIWRR